MTLKTVNNLGSLIAKLGIGCVICLLLSFGILLHAQEKTKAEFIGMKPEMDTAKMKEMTAAKMKVTAEAKEQAAARGNRFRGRQNRENIDFGENETFYKVIINNNLFRPLGWTPPNNEPAYSLVGTAVDANGTVSQATLLEKRSNRYHFVTIGTKLGDMTVKDIQAKQVTLDKVGEAITLKTGSLQFLTTSRGNEGGREGERREGQSEEEGNSKNSANAEKRKQAAQQKQTTGEWRGMNREMIEKLKQASEGERREMIQQMRRQRERGGRRGRGRD